MVIEDNIIRLPPLRAGGAARERNITIIFYLLTLNSLDFAR